MLGPKNDEYWMLLALQQARLAAQSNEVPVGAVLVDQDRNLIASGYNHPITANDPTAHAEIVVIREAASQMDNYRLPNTTIYVTIEPCAMCVGALVQARVSRIVYGAPEPKTGAIQSAHHLFDSGEFNHCPEITGGILKDECSILMSQFFQQKRKEKKSNNLGG